MSINRNESDTADVVQKSKVSKGFAQLVHQKDKDHHNHLEAILYV